MGAEHEAFSASQSNDFAKRNCRADLDIVSTLSLIYNTGIYRWLGMCSYQFHTSASELEGRYGIKSTAESLTLIRTVYVEMYSISNIVDNNVSSFMRRTKVGKARSRIDLTMLGSNCKPLSYIGSLRVN